MLRRTTGNVLIKRLSMFTYTWPRYLMPDNYQDDIGLFTIKKIFGLVYIDNDGNNIPLLKRL